MHTTEQAARTDLNVLKAVDFREAEFVSALWDCETERTSTVTILTDVCLETNRESSLSACRWLSRGIWKPVEQLAKIARKRKREMERDSMSLYLRFLGIVRISASFLRLAEYYVNGIINIIICTLSLCFIKINHIVSLDEFIDCFCNLHYINSFLR